MSDIVLIPERTFRRTSGVHFADLSVEGSNGLDLVEHQSCSVSPPNSQFLNRKQWYRHSPTRLRQLPPSALGPTWIERYRDRRRLR